jgi:hypothetical protein
MRTAAAIGTGFVCFLACALGGESAEPAKALDPAAWGGDHVGKPIPEYVTGDECLFCHRADVGPAWTRNRHHRTIHEADVESASLRALKESPPLQKLAGEVKLLLGGHDHQRFLKPAQSYGKLELLSVAWAPATGKEGGKLLSPDNPHWDARKFQDACAGCHTTAVDSKAGTFSALSLDCYACHGDVNLQHSKDASLVFLAKKRKDPTRVVISICAQCHVRTGKSSSSGLPYPNNFVAGDNLWRDFKVDFSRAQMTALDPADRHVLENVRDVILLEKEKVTCLSCHEIHKQSSSKHRQVSPSDYCLNCHYPTGAKKIRKAYEVHSPTCDY